MVSNLPLLEAYGFIIDRSTSHHELALGHSPNPYDESLHERNDHCTMFIPTSNALALEQTPPPLTVSLT